jgi:anti-sigma factor (TIGR02949 family)
MKTRDSVTCEDVARQLWAFIDGELTPELNEQVRAHLEDCARCYPRYDFHRAFLAFLGKHAEQPAPPGLRSKVWEQILKEHERGEDADAGA